MHLSNVPQRSLMFRHKGAIWSVESKVFFDYKLKLLSYSYKKKIAKRFLRCIPVGIYSKLPFSQVRRLTPLVGTGSIALQGYQRVSNSRVEVFERVSNSRGEVFQRVTKSLSIWKVLIKCLEQRFLMDGYIIVINFISSYTKTTFCFPLKRTY